MIQAYRLNRVEKPNYMYSNAQFTDALNASSLISKKVARFYTEFEATDETVQTYSKGYSLICNNSLIIETEDGDWKSLEPEQVKKVSDYLNKNSLMGRSGVVVCMDMNSEMEM